MKTLRALFTLLLKPSRLKALLSYGHKGYLAEIGWFTAFDQKAAVDNSGAALPWVTYSFIDFIKPRLKPDMELFEYGSGNSTWFYAARVKKVISIEHDSHWYEKVKTNNPSNAEMIFTSLDINGQYAKMAVTRQQPFHLIIVDGRDRVHCCIHAVEALTADGVLVLDDSERPEYQEVFRYLQEKGFRSLSFSGISPGLFYQKSTTVFYREGNCLDI